MKRWLVSIRIEGWAAFEVSADNEEQAKDIAYERFESGDDGSLDFEPPTRDRVKEIEP